MPTLDPAEVTIRVPLPETRGIDQELSSWGFLVDEEYFDVLQDAVETWVERGTESAVLRSVAYPVKGGRLVAVWGGKQWSKWEAV